MPGMHRQTDGSGGKHIIVALYLSSMRDKQIHVMSSASQASPAIIMRGKSRRHRGGRNPLVRACGTQVNAGDPAAGSSRPRFDQRER